ncbi:MAG TPA: hypothetical protein VFO35_20555 [Steroidobacteraceae bacterium]|nr:hypothetical protein [Steroidobacteraceae bacterium]
MHPICVTQPPVSERRDPLRNCGEADPLAQFQHRLAHRFGPRSLDCGASNPRVELDEMRDRLYCTSNAPTVESPDQHLFEQLV